MTPLDVDRIKSCLRTAYVGQQIEYRARTASTNTVAKLLAGQGAPEGTVVIADLQDAGRGRLDRRWLSPSNANLLLTIVFCPSLRPSEAQRLTMICALATVDAIQTVTGLSARLKWPNDILVSGKKVGGILTELGLRGGELGFAVVGIGLNVNMSQDDLPEELRPVATSLAEELRCDVDREDLLCALLARIETRYDALRAGEAPVDEWMRNLATLGELVTVNEPHGAMRLEGIAEAVDEDGALLLRLADGSLRRVLAGDVTLRK